MNLTLQIVALIGLAPLVQGTMRSIRARLCGRPGPGPLQPYRDLRKLLGKEALATEASSAVFLAAPGIVFGVALTFAVLVPPIGSASATPVNAVAIVLLLALGRGVLVLAALDTRSAFAAMAASREMTFASLTEAPLLLALLSTSVAAGLPAAHGPGGETLVAGVLAAAALLLVMLSEIARVPVDNQETHYELTMIHEGLVLEYSGWHLALLQAAAYIRQAAFVILAARMLPGNGVVTLVWIAVIVAGIPAIERTTAKLRLFVVPQVFTSATILALASIGLRIAGRGAW
jgi:formate hydrogenlyase subunit 4